MSYPVGVTSWFNSYFTIQIWIRTEGVNQYFPHQYRDRRKKLSHVNQEKYNKILVHLVACFFGENSYKLQCRIKISTVPKIGFIIGGKALNGCISELVEIKQNYDTVKLMAKHLASACGLSCEFQTQRRRFRKTHFDDRQKPRGVRNFIWEDGVQSSLWDHY